MDTVYIRYFGEVIKFKRKVYKYFVDHLVRFRKIEGIKDKFPPHTIAWYMDEFGIEEIEHPIDGSFRAFTDHRNGDDLLILSAEEFNLLRNERIAELSKTQRKKFKQEEVLDDTKQPMLEYLGLELFKERDPKRILELNLPCYDDFDADYRDMKNLGYRDGDRHTEKMARRIQFWRTYALSMAPVDIEVKQQQKLKKRESVVHGKDGGRPVEKEITDELFDAALKSASKKIKLPTSRNRTINNGTVFKAVAREVKVLTGASAGTLDRWLKKNELSRNYIYEKMPDHIRSRMKN